MILCVKILVKILVKVILIENKFGKNNEFSFNLQNKNVKKNLKMIGTVIYRGVTDLFLKKVPENPKSLKKIEFKSISKISRKTSFGKVENPDKHEKYDDKFHKALSAFLEKTRNSKNDIEISYEIENKKLEKKPEDISENEIENMDMMLYPKIELNNYYNLSTKHNFKIEELIISWIDKLYNIIY